MVRLLFLSVGALALLVALGAPGQLQARPFRGSLPGAPRSMVTPGMMSRPMFTPGFGRGFTPGFGSGFTPGFRSGFTPGFGRGFTPGFGSGFTPGFRSGFTPGFGRGFTPGFRTTPTMGTPSMMSTPMMGTPGSRGGMSDPRFPFGRPDMRFSGMGLGF